VLAAKKTDALTMQCAPAHCHGESTSLDLAIVWNVVGGLTASWFENLPIVMLINPSGLEEQISDE